MDQKFDAATAPGLNGTYLCTAEFEVGGGIMGIGANFVPKALDRSLLDDIYTVADEEAQVELVRSLVADGRPVVSVSEGITGLEERFLALTRGDVN